MSRIQASIIIIGLAITSIAAQPEIRTLAIHESAEIYVKPDLCILHISVFTHDKDKTQAFDRNVEIMSQVREVLKDNGIKPEDIKSLNFQIQRSYRYDKHDNRVPTGHNVVHELKVKIRNFSKIVGISEQVLKAGASSIRNIIFTVENPKLLQAEVRSEAMKSAKIKALEMAELAGMKLGKPIVVSEFNPRDSRFTESIIPKITIRTEETGSMALDPGEVKLTYTIYITYELL